MGTRVTCVGVQAASSARTATLPASQLGRSQCPLLLSHRSDLTAPPQLDPRPPALGEATPQASTTAPRPPAAAPAPCSELRRPLRTPGAVGAAGARPSCLAVLGMTQGSTHATKCSTTNTLRPQHAVWRRPSWGGVPSTVAHMPLFWPHSWAQDPPEVEKAKNGQWDEAQGSSMTGSAPLVSPHCACGLGAPLSPQED